MKAAKKTAVEIPWENPLIPNKRLRQLYTSMAELRLLEQHLATRTPRRKSVARPIGEEACRASTALSLLPGDLSSDPTSGPATSFLRGAKLDGLIATVASDRTQLPTTSNPAARLHLVIGASLAAKKQGSVVLAYVYPGDLTVPQWKPIFRLASDHAAPVIFVALPQPARTALKPGKLSEASTASGVPGITVDAADAVALYRVVHESMLRARSGGGAVLMECIPFQLPGKKSLPADPVLNMRDSLLHRKVANDGWFRSVEARFAARLTAPAL